MRILVIEDDCSTADYMAKGLIEVGHVVDIARTGKDGMFLALGEPYDVITTDRKLPGLDGLSIVRALRAAGNRTPVLMVTALREVGARVEGLDAGADDYLGKPFAFSELRARVDALARRPTASTETTALRVADLEMDLLTRVVRRGDTRIALMPTEFRLLEYMMRHAGRVLTRTALLEHVWDFNFDPMTNVVDVHISRLRKKIDQGFPPPLLHTYRGAGYALGS